MLLLKYKGNTKTCDNHILPAIACRVCGERGHWGTNECPSHIRFKPKSSCSTSSSEARTSVEAEQEDEDRRSARGRSAALLRGSSSRRWGLDPHAISVQGGREQLEVAGSLSKIPGQETSKAGARTDRIRSERIAGLWHRQFDRAQYQAHELSSRTAEIRDVEPRSLMIVQRSVRTKGYLSTCSCPESKGTLWATQ